MRKLHLRKSDMGNYTYMHHYTVNINVLKAQKNGLFIQTAIMS